MSYATRYWNSVAHLRELSRQDTCIHHVPTLLKLAAAVHYLLAVLSRQSDFAVGCYCEDERHCHRSVLKELLRESGALLAE